jgi:hypothetical protein
MPNAKARGTHSGLCSGYAAKPKGLADVPPIVEIFAILIKKDRSSRRKQGNHAMPQQF